MPLYHIIIEISNYDFYCYNYCCYLAYFMDKLIPSSIASILVVSDDREFTRLDPRFSRVDVELSHVNQIS